MRVRFEHRAVALGRTSICVRGRIVGPVGLGLDDATGQHRAAVDRADEQFSNEEAGKIERTGRQIGPA